MAVSSTETVADIVQDALLKIEAHTLGQTVDSTQEEHAIRVLERMLKGWQQEHGTPYFLKAEQTLTLTTAASYTLSPVRPIRILQANLKRDGIEIPMIELTRDEYDELPDKDATGIPTQFYYDRQRESALFYIWPLLSSASGETIDITYERESEDIGAASDTIDLPVEWYEAAIDGLAARLLPTYGKLRTPEAQAIRADAKSALDRALGAGVDGSSVYWRAERA